jgi:nucleolar protein 9
MDKVLGYFKEAEKLLDANDFSTAEDYDLFLQNVFSEVEGLEYRLACSHDGSSIVEKILTHATDFQLRVFFEKVREKWLDMCVHRYASHVAETWLRQAVLKATGNVDTTTNEKEEEEKGLPTIKEQLVDISAYMTEDFVRLAEDQYGTHVLRMLLKLWGGDLEGHQRLDFGSDSLEALVDRIFSIPKEVFSSSNGVLNQHVSPILQFIITKLGNLHSPQYQKFLNTLFPGIFNPGDDNNATKTFLKTADHEIGSRFMEAFISSLDEAAFLIFVNKLVIPKLAKLLDGFHSNFVLQTVVSKCHNVEQFAILTKGLQPLASDLIVKRRHGVLMRLAQWVIDHELAGAEKAMEIIFEAFQLRDGSEQKLSFNAISRLQTKGSLDEGKPLIAGGCSLLQLLPFFPADISKPVIDGFLDASVASILSFSTHPNGSRVIEACLDSPTVSSSVKQRTIRKIRDHVDTLAVDKFGSHIVDRAWRLATPELCEKIVQRLLDCKRRLEDSQHGRLVLRNCRAYEFERDVDGWRNSEVSTIRKRNLFADILDDGGNKGSKEKKSKNKK